MDASLQHINTMNQIADRSNPLFMTSWRTSQIASNDIVSASFYQYSDYQQLPSPADNVLEEASLLNTYNGEEFKKEHTLLNFQAKQSHGYGFCCDLPCTPERSNAFAFADHSLQDSLLLGSNSVIAYPGHKRYVHPQSRSIPIDNRGVRSVEIGCRDQQYLTNLQLFAAPCNNEIKKHPRESTATSSNLTSSTIKKSKRVHRVTERDNNINKLAVSAECTSITSEITKLSSINSSTSGKLSGASIKSRHSWLGPALNTNLKPRAPHGSNSAQTVAARNRRERINARLKILQELVPNGSKVDLVTMLEKAINYVKFLQLQLRVLSNDQYWHEDEELRMAAMQEDGGEGNDPKPREVVKKSKADTMSSCCSG